MLDRIWYACTGSSVWTPNSLSVVTAAEYVSRGVVAPPLTTPTSSSCSNLAEPGRRVSSRHASLLLGGDKKDIIVVFDNKPTCSILPLHQLPCRQLLTELRQDRQEPRGEVKVQLVGSTHPKMSGQNNLHIRHVHGRQYYGQNPYITYLTEEDLVKVIGQSLENGGKLQEREMFCEEKTSCPLQVRENGRERGRQFLPGRLLHLPLLQLPVLSPISPHTRPERVHHLLDQSVL